MEIKTPVLNLAQFSRHVYSTGGEIPPGYKLIAKKDTKTIRLIALSQAATTYCDCPS